jgi:hypothetical protein
MTDLSHHPTKVKAVWDAWGMKWDKIGIAILLIRPSVRPNKNPTRPVPISGTNWKKRFTAFATSIQMSMIGLSRSMTTLA